MQMPFHLFFLSCGSFFSQIVFSPLWQWGHPFDSFNKQGKFEIEVEVSLKKQGVSGLVQLNFEARRL